VARDYGQICQESDSDSDEGSDANWFDFLHGFPLWLGGQSYDYFEEEILLASFFA